MKPAIAIPYCEGQNEPSKPITRIVDGSDENQLKRLYTTYINEDSGWSDIEVRTVDKFGYSDLLVVNPDMDDMYLMITFLTEE